MHIYYINLARRTDRRDFMEAQFARLGLPAIRLEAITPETIPENARKKSAGRLPPAALSCSLSHVAAAKMLLDSRDRAAMIFEDDAILSSRLPDFLAALEADLPNFGAMRFEASSDGVRLQPSGQKVGPVELMRPYSWEGGAAGYILSRVGAEHVAASDLLTQMLPDVALFQPYGPLGRRLGLYQTYPALCIQSHLRKTASFSGFGSDLPYGLPAPASPPTTGERFQQRLAHFANVFEREVIFGSQRTFHQLLGAKKYIIPFLD